MNKLDESLLTSLPPFRNFSKTQIRTVLDLATPKRFGQELAVFTEGDPAKRFYLLLDGHIRVVRTTPNGDQIIVLHIAPGQLFGIAAAMRRDTYPATAMTADECLTLSWPNALWHKFAEDYPGFATENYKTVGERMGEVNNRVVEMATQHVEQRVACTLLRLINQNGKKVENGIAIDFPITRQNLSEMTGTTLHTVSRLLSAWQKEGIVASTRKRVAVTDPHRLVLISEAGI
ncbi:MAG: Crp/Fnr family transcriptional regulator [Rhodobacteraceae bacterium]|nr:Crp/Fnr family transcriptional regulator [Paracoccaceae bacterium]